jgi:hypothetical protein
MTRHVISGFAATALVVCTSGNVVRTQESQHGKHGGPKVGPVVEAVRESSIVFAM